MGRHRHRIILPKTLEGFNRYMADPYYSIHGPFEYCPICKRVPTEFLGQDPVNAAERFSSDAVPFME